MSHWLDDLRYSRRALVHSPGFTAVAVLTLALGIGANTAVFTLVNALLIRSFPFPHPERLVLLDAVHFRRGNVGVGAADFRDWKARNTVFEKMTYTFSSTRTMTGKGEPERVKGREVAAEFFETMGVEPQLGRSLRDEEQIPGRNQVMVLSHRFWQRRFGGDPGVLGQSITLDGKAYTVIGVMPPSFRFNEGEIVEYWLPMQHASYGRQSHQYSAYARLKPGVAIASAQEQMDAICKRLEQEYADNKGWGVRVYGLRRVLLDEFGPALFVFMTAVAAVLLIGCANVTNLLLARATVRAKELAVRAALGASRWALIRLTLIESALISVAGAAFGIALAAWSINGAGRILPDFLEIQDLATIDGTVLAFTVVLSLVSTLLVGVLPGLRASRIDLAGSMKQSASQGSSGRMRALSVLAVSEVAVAVLLLTVAGLLVRSFAALLKTDLGFQTDSVLTLLIQLPRTRYSESGQRSRFIETLTERLGSIPGVVAAGAVDAMPMGRVYSGGSVKLEGGRGPSNWTEASVATKEATPDYFRALNIPLRKGRFFDERDKPGSEPVVIVNETFARRFFPSEDPVGKRIEIWNDRCTIAGVVGDVRHWGPADRIESETYRPFAQTPISHMFLTVRTAGAAAGVARAIRSEVRALDPELPISDIRSMNEVFDQNTALRRHLMTTIGLFAGAALLLAAIGLAGVQWYVVSRRTHEIGIRIALGADRGDVIGGVLASGLKLTLLGTAAGLGAALVVTRMLERVLYGVKPNDAPAFAAAAILAAVIAVAAMLPPARRAASVDPMTALRQE